MTINVQMTARETEQSEMHPEAFAAGAAAENRRCSAHARLGAASGATEQATRAIEGGRAVETSLSAYRNFATKNGNVRELERAIAQLSGAPDIGGQSAAPRTRTLLDAAADAFCGTESPQ